MRAIRSQRRLLRYLSKFVEHFALYWTYSNAAQELADRQTRPNVADRRLITSRTSDSLHTLAVSNGIYRSGSQLYNRLRNRSSRTGDSIMNHEFYEPESPDEEDFDDMEVGTDFGVVEGARIDSALYDLYGRSPATSHPNPPRPFLHWSSSRTANRHPSTTGSQHIHLPHPHSNLFRVNSRTQSSSRDNNASSLARQSSIRRPARSRMNDFHDFSARRRSTHRNSGEPGSPPSAFAETRRSPTVERPVIPPPPEADQSASPLPRADTFVVMTPPPPAPQLSPSPSLVTNVPMTIWTEPYYVDGPSEPGYIHYPPERPTHPLGTNIPRLRHGGLRPPELMLAGPEDTLPSETTSLLRPEGGGNSDENRASVVRSPSSSSLANWALTSEERRTERRVDARSMLPLSLPMPRSPSEDANTQQA